jgi:hypothetical protein
LKRSHLSIPMLRSNHSAGASNIVVAVTEI